MQGKFCAAPRAGGSPSGAIRYILGEELTAKVRHDIHNDPLHASQRSGLAALYDEARSRADLGAGSVWQPTNVTAGRPSSIYARNVASLETAAAEIEAVGRTQPRVKNFVQHIIIALSEAESKTTSDEKLIRAAEFALDRAGFKDHQAVFAVHRDTPNAHVHVAVASVNPLTLRAWKSYRNYNRLHWALRESELRHDMTDEHGLAIVRDRGLTSERIEWAALATRKGWSREREQERLEDLAKAFLRDNEGLETPEDRRDRVVFDIRKYLESMTRRQEIPLRADLHAIAARLTTTLEPGLDGTLRIRLMEPVGEEKASRYTRDSLGERTSRFAKWTPTETTFDVPAAWLTEFGLKEKPAAKLAAWVADIGDVARSEAEVLAVVQRDPARISRDLIASGSATFTPEDFDRWCADRLTDKWFVASNYAQKRDATLHVLSPDTSVPLYTTKKQKALETSVFERAKKLANMPDLSYDPALLKEAIALEEQALAKVTPGFTFSFGQLRGFDSLQYRFSVIQGDAGTGKSAIMGVIRRYCEMTGNDVAGFSTSQMAAENLGKKSGIRSVNTARAKALELTRGEAMIRPYSRNVFDESSMVSLEAADAGLRRMESEHASGIWILDTAQLPNIAAGDTGRVLTEAAKATGRYAEITKNFRQTGDDVRWMHKAVPYGGKAIREQNAVNFRKYLERYIDKGHVTFHADRQSEIAAKAQDIIDAKARGEDVLATGFARTDGLHTNRAIRRALGYEGTGHTFRMQRGVREFARGDRVVFEENAEQMLGVLNGYTGTVLATTPESMTVRLDIGGERTVRPAEYKQIDYGWCLTTHKAQGQGVALAVPTLSKSDDARSAHVALTRCVTGLHVHTRMTKDELLDHLTTAKALKPKDDALLFEELVKQSGGPDTPWAKMVREGMTMDAHPTRKAHARDTHERNEGRTRDLDATLRRYASARERATTPGECRNLERAEGRELRAIFERYKLDSFVTWAAKNKRRIEHDAPRVARTQATRRGISR